MRKIAYKYELLDHTNIHKKWLSNVSSAHIRIVYLTQIKCTGTVTMKDDEDINFLTDRLKIYMCIDDVEYPICIFLMSTPAREISATSIVRNIQLYDLCQVLTDDKLEKKLVLAKGTNVVNEVKRLLGTWSFNIADSTATLNSQKIYEAGESKLTVINDLLSTVNYNSLRCDSEGFYVSEAYVEPSEKEVEFSYTDDANSIICADIVDTLDLFNVPNVFVRYTNAIDTENPLSYTYVNDNTSSITSTVNRGRRVVSVEECDASDLNTLIAKTKRDVFNTISAYNKLSFEAQVNEKLLDTFMPKVSINFKDIQDNFIITSAEWDCKVGATANLEARKVVLI